MVTIQGKTFWQEFPPLGKDIFLPTAIGQCMEHPIIIKL
jgi:hypothetical protein